MTTRHPLSEFLGWVDAMSVKLMSCWIWCRCRAPKHRVFVESLLVWVGREEEVDGARDDGPGIPHIPPPFLNRTMRWLCICFYWTYTVYNSCVPSEIVYFPCEWYTIMLVLCSVCELENAFTRMHWYAQYPLFHATRIERMRHTHRYVCYGMVLMVGRMVGWTEDFFFALFLTLYLRDEEWGTNRQSALKLVMRRRWYRMIER